MKPVHLLRLAMAAAAVLATVSEAAAQAPFGLLNVLEVRRLVAQADPAAHARLSAHFTALAAQYAEEAGRDTAMAKASTGNSNRQMGASPTGHCERLAELNTQAAATVRQLAAHHEQLANGAASEPPTGAARFEGGEGAPEPTDAQLAVLAARARTPSEHGVLAEYFLTLARRHAAAAEEHTTMARMYRGHPNRRGGDPAVHCDRMVMLSHDAAEEARATARAHSQLANAG